MTNCSHMWNFYCLQIFTILLLKQINILFKFECFCNNKKKKSTLPIDFSSDFSASVVLWCTSAVESVTLDSELLELLCFDPSASEDFWDNWSWLVNFSCYMTTNREKKTTNPQRVGKKRLCYNNYKMTKKYQGTAHCYLKCFFRDSHLSPDHSKQIIM